MTRKPLTSAAALLAVAATMIALPGTAQAEDRRTSREASVYRHGCHE